MDDGFFGGLFILGIIFLLFLIILGALTPSVDWQKYEVDCARQQGTVLEQQCYQTTGLTKINVPKDKS